MTDIKTSSLQKSFANALIIVFIYLLVGCSSSTQKAPIKKQEQEQSLDTPISKYQLFSFPFEKVWSATVQSFSETEFRPEIINSESGVIKSKPSYILGMFFSDKTQRLDYWPKKYEVKSSASPKGYLVNYANCPSWSLMEFAIEDMSIYVTKESETQTKIVVEYYPQGVDMIRGARKCASKGVMEKKILDSISGKLK